jgi:gliding motility-associated-like protein
MSIGVHPNLFMKTLVAALFLFILSPSLAQNQTAKSTPTGIWYYEYLPPDYNLNTDKYPIVFFLHGMGERGNTEAELARVANAGPPRHVKNGYKFPFIMISPQLKTSYSGWPNSQIDYMIEYCTKSGLRVDLSRVYLIGLSLGGGGVWQYAQESAYGQKLAAIIPVCGSGNNTAKACTFGITNLPVWAFHGDADPTVSVSKTINMVNAINACNPAPSPLAKMTIYPGVGHNSWDNAFRTDNLLHTPNAYQWLLQFKNGTLVANAGADKSINLPTNSTTIAGSATVQNATVSSYAWSKVSGPAGTMANATSPTLSLTNLGEGISVYKLLVTASNGEMATDEVTITVIGSNKAPTANAGPDIAIALPTNSVTITGIGTDTDGSITGYSWAKTSGPAATQSGTSTATLKLTTMVAGTYTYSFKVTDNIGATATDDVKIVVSSSAVNQLPVVNAGTDKIINLPTNTTNITATATDADGSIASYLWEKVSGPTATLTTITSSTVGIASLVAGNYVFRITVTDNSGGKATDDISVNVVAANQSPVANAGSDITLTLPTNSTNISGSATDADGSVTSYSWTVVGGPNSPTLSNAASPTLSLSGLIAGTYTMRLTVTDNNLSSSFDEVNVIVKAAVVNSLPVANAGGDKSVNLPTSNTSLSGSGSDSDGSIASYSWTKTSGPSVTMANTTASTLLLSNLVAGIYKFQLLVTDNQGATDTDVATITVVAANQSPAADAGSDITITLPTNTATLSGSGSDPDGSISGYLWEKVGGPAAGTMANATNPILTLTGLAEGIYTFSLTVTDNLGFTDIDEVTVTVNSVVINIPPVASAGGDQSLSLPANSIILNGSGTDSDGTIATFAWSLVSGPSVTIAGANTANLSLTNLQAGSYTFRLTVTDNSGDSHSDDVVVSVQPETVNQTPLANAGADVTLTLPINSTTLNGLGTDADGTIAGYSWTKLSGPAGTLSGAATANLDLSNLVAGTYQFQLTVTDDKGATGSDNVSVFVNALNTAPIANAGADITINLPTNSTLITGSATDADGTIASYSWVQTSGPGTATLSGAATNALTASNLLQGTYIFTVTVTDDDGATDTDDVKVIINAANLAPTANAGANKIITLPTNTTTITGSGTDTDGTIVTYAWTQLSGVIATLSNQNTKTLTVTVGGAGVYTFRLTVTDNEGATAFDDMDLTVNAAIVNQPPSANAGGNKSITLPVNAINLTGSASDPDGSIATYQWTKVSGPSATLTNPTTSTLSLTNLVEGTYLFRLTATDNGGLTASSDATVTVLPEIINLAPVANAGADKTLALPTNSLNLTGSGNDADGTVVSYAWIKVSGPAATLTNQNLPVLSVTGMVQGTYIFRLTVVDDKGASGSDDVTIVVNPAIVNQFPTASAGPDKSMTLPVNSITITGTGSDPDGSIASYQWTKLTGPGVSMSGTTTTNLSLSNLVEGSYVFRLKVTDNGGATGTDDVKIIVQPATVNQSPVANAGADQVITLPLDIVNIFGAGSDPDGSITNYLWTQISGPAATLENPATPTLTVSSMTAGTYVFRLTVTDNLASIDADEVTVIVNPLATNQIPVAFAGPDKNITLPTSITTLDGSGSDADGSIVKYTWAKVSGPAVTMGPSNLPTLSLSALVEGTYAFRLTVEDDKGAKAEDEVVVTVTPAAINASPTVNAGSDITLFSPENSVALSGDASDSDGNITAITWTQVSGDPVTIATPNAFFTQINGLTVGTFGFRLTVTDDQSASAFDEIVIVVEPAGVNQPPFASAGEDTSIKLPVNTITLTGSGVDPDGTISTHLWEITSGPSATLSGQNTASVTLTNMLEGTYSLRLTVTDDDGATGEDFVLVTVNSATLNLSPVVDAGLDQTVELPTNQIILTGIVTDDQALSGISFTWQQIDGPSAATLTNANQNAVTVSNLVEGNYTLRLTATDAGGLSSFDEVSINVFPEPIPPGVPEVNAGDDIEIQLPVNAITLSAVANAPDGLIVSYVWQQLEGAPVILDPSDSSIVVVSDLAPGTYRFSVTVQDVEGRETSDEVIVIVLDENPLIRPRNLFSPDQKGDLTTETWTIENADLISGCEIMVYDRQGQKVFASVGYPVPWDGTFNGKGVPDGAYFYVIRCSGKISKTGSVTIARIK